MKNIYFLVLVALFLNNCSNESRTGQGLGQYYCSTIQELEFHKFNEIIMDKDTFGKNGNSLDTFLIESLLYFDGSICPSLEFYGQNSSNDFDTLYLDINDTILLHKDVMEFKKSQSDSSSINSIILINYSDCNRLNFFSNTKNGGSPLFYEGTLFSVNENDKKLEFSLNSVNEKAILILYEK